MKLTTFLARDHETVKSLFENYKEVSGRDQNSRKQIFEQIRRELLLHSQLELEIFYPALENTVSTRAVQLVAAAKEEHQTIEQFLDEMDHIDPQNNEFDLKMSALMEAVRRHIETEEDDIFGEARTNLSEFRLEQLGLEAEERRRLIDGLAA